MRIKFPFPDSSLNPNRKNGKHWAVTKKAKDAAKEQAFYLTKQVLSGSTIGDITAMDIEFIQPTRHRRDLDNLLASFKPYQDGMCLALGIDDHQIEVVALKRSYGSGAVVVNLSGEVT